MLSHLKLLIKFAFMSEMNSSLLSVCFYFNVFCDDGHFFFHLTTFKNSVVKCQTLS